MDLLFLFMVKFLIDSILLEKGAWLYSMKDCKPQAAGQVICNECIHPSSRVQLNAINEGLYLLR